MRTPALVFIDEAGINTALSYNYGWAPAGMTPVIERPSRGKNMTLIGAIALGGQRVLVRREGTLNGVGFVAFLREALGPTLVPGDVVVMDGPNLHRVAGVAEALAEFGATALYLPAYSPELNPIELAWAWVKRLVRQRAPRTPARLRKLVEEIWRNIPVTLIKGWIRHCGYPVGST